VFYALYIIYVYLLTVTEGHGVEVGTSSNSVFPDSDLGTATGCTGPALHGFCKSLRANAGTLCRTGLQLLILLPFQSIIYHRPIIRRFVAVRVLGESLNNQANNKPVIYELCECAIDIAATNNGGF
jgi:hypothetical protein